MLFRTRHAVPRVRLPEVMRLKRVQLPEPLSAAAAKEFEEAMRRCLACNWGQLCAEMIAAGDAQAFSLFCLNCAYMQRVKSESLRFR
jgi:hypothetical protein